MIFCILDLSFAETLSGTSQTGMDYLGGIPFFIVSVERTLKTVMQVLLLNFVYLLRCAEIIQFLFTQCKH